MAVAIAANSPDNRAAIEAVDLSLGLNRWDQLVKLKFTRKAHTRRMSDRSVVGKAESTKPIFSCSAFVQMAPARGFKGTAGRYMAS
ncbi:MAG: hypothetical protein ACYC4S_09890 [Rhodoferax sp.]